MTDQWTIREIEYGKLTPFKDRCLEHCRSPAYFFAENWRAGASGAFRMGVLHGAYCLGCCWDCSSSAAS